MITAKTAITEIDKKLVEVRKLKHDLKHLPSSFTMCYEVGRLNGKLEALKELRASLYEQLDDMVLGMKK